MPRGVSRTGRRVCLSAYTVPLPSLCSCLCVAGPCVAGMSTTKSVVVQCGAFNRIVSFSTAAPVGRTERELLCEAIRVAYSERIGPNDRLTLQVRSQEWDGMLIDFFGDEIEDKMSKMSFIIMIAQLCTIYTFLNNQICGNYMYIIVVAVVLAVQSSTTVMLTCMGECRNSSIR